MQNKTKVIALIVSILLIWIPLGFINGKIIATIILGILAIMELFN